jgi:plasmid maintenance system antidote protein VapI
MGLERTGIGSTKVWLAVQADWDLWQAQSANK